jgi:hypothetical protein
VRVGGVLWREVWADGRVLVRWKLARKMKGMGLGGPGARNTKQLHL